MISRQYSADSRALLSLLRGNPVAKPPLWEPWFQMHGLLRDLYSGFYGRMASELGHAAVPGPYAPHPFLVYQQSEIPDNSPMWYAGGHFSTDVPVSEWVVPDQRIILPKAERSMEEARLYQRAVWHTIPWCFHAVATAMGLENFAYACYDHANFVASALAKVEESNRDAISILPRHLRPDFYLLDGDCAYRTGLMVAPSLLRSLTEEPTRRTLSLLADLGIPCIFHSDGKLQQVLPYLNDLGIAAVHGCEAVANDLGELVENHGREMVLCGNMDVVFLKDASPAEIRARTLEMLKTGSSRSRFIASCNTSPLDYIPRENYLMFAATIRQYQP